MFWNKDREFNHLKDHVINNCREIMHHDHKIDFKLLDFSPSLDDLIIGLRDEYVTYDYKKVVLSKKLIFNDNNKPVYDGLFIRSSEYKRNYEFDFISCISKYLSAYYDKCVSYKDIFSEWCKKVPTDNKNFKVSIGYNNIYLKLVTDNGKKYENFIDYDGKFDFRSDPIVKSMLYNKEFEFFKKIFVRIEDCPKWMRDELRERREADIRSIKMEEEKSKYTKIKRKVLHYFR